MIFGGIEWFTGTADGDAFSGSSGLPTNAWGEDGADVLKGYSDEERATNPDGLLGVLRQDDADHLYGGAGNDSLYGGGGGDWLQGDDGNDYLCGGLGKDDLFGGAGADRFSFGRLLDSAHTPDTGIGVAFADAIHDFEPGLDRIQLSGWNVIPGMPGRWIGLAVAEGACAQLRAGYHFDGGMPVLDIYAAGDDVVDGQVVVHNVASLAASDIIW